MSQPKQITWFYSPTTSSASSPSSFARITLLGVLLGISACTTTSASVQTTAKYDPSLYTNSATADAQVLGIKEDVQPDSEVETMLNPYAERVKARAQRQIGMSDTAMKRGKGESLLGNFVTDMMRSGLLDMAGEDPIACLTNAGGLRADLPSGVITEGNIVEVMPFDNTLILFDMTGNHVRNLVERVAVRGDHLSGIRFETSGGTVTRLEIGGAPVDDKKTYRICTTDYVFEGGGRYDFTNAMRINYTGILLRDLLIHEVERASNHQKNIESHLDGRAVGSGSKE